MRNKRAPKTAEKALKYQFNRALHSCYTPGESRHEAKKSGEAIFHIYGHKTFENYQHFCGYFCDWIGRNHPDVRKMEEAKEYVPEYIKSLQDRNYSAYTQKTYLSALAKAYRDDFADVQTDKRNRYDIKRGRNETVYSQHFNEDKHPELVNLCNNTGLRRDELTHLKGSCVQYREDGQAYIHLDGSHTKGGKERDVLILNNDPQTIELINSRPSSEYIYPVVSRHFNVHSHRAEYAIALYESLARPLDELSKSEKYFCRGDYKGVVLDRAALSVASESLGHSRDSIIPQHYAYSLLD